MKCAHHENDGRIIFRIEHLIITTSAWALGMVVGTVAFALERAIFSMKKKNPLLIHIFEVLQNFCTQYLHAALSLWITLGAQNSMGWVGRGHRKGGDRGRERTYNAYERQQQK